MPKSATPNTRMVIPSLLSQFVPNVSSRANIDFMRCCAVGFGAEERSAADCGGATTRALAGGGTATGAGGVCGVPVRGGSADVTDRWGIGGFAVAGGCGGVFGATGAGGGGELVMTSAASGFLSPRATSTGLLAVGVAGFVKITSRTAAAFS